jgi:hypothetical protein
MEAHTAAHYAQMQAEGTPLRHCHMMSEQQWAYNDWLAETAGADVQKVRVLDQQLLRHRKTHVRFEQYCTRWLLEWRDCAGCL